MSGGAFFIILAIGIIALMLLIAKFKVHPVLSLLFVAFFIGVTMGFSPLKSIELIAQGFGDTLGGVGIPIILGAILAMGIHDTAAAKSIANFFIKLFKGKNLELAPALTAYIVSIPVFGDITSVLTSNIASVLSARKKISMSTMTSFTGLALNLTHAVVPPTPGILAVAILLKADLGLVIFWGIIVTFIAFIVTWLLLKKWTEKEYIEPNPELVKGISPVNTDDIDDLLIKGENLPGTLESLLPIFIPVILISMSSFIAMILPEGNIFREASAFLGNKIVALSLGVIYTMLLGLKYKKSVIQNNKDMSVNYESENIKDILLNNWVVRGLNVAIIALIVTGMGGALSTIIKSAPAVSQLNGFVDGLNIPSILVPFFLGTIMMTAVGSMTTAGMTAAAIVLPMLPALGLSPLAATLAIGAGTLAINHVNNSGFWVITQFFNLNVKQGIKYITIPEIVAAIFCIICIVILNAGGLF
ncbi:gluconate transporter [Mahella sp.]|uniref:GntP family permease n=1 Tax=Mahella sp. TaxID=2798721 RepID=UPI0025B7DC8D|nr:gluconate transporter [Mahella sp.]MBZ4665634.1 Gluconate transporter [Mahella sp.]